MIELVKERELLLERVANNTPRRRKQTLSVPGVDFNYGYGSFGTDNLGVFDVESGDAVDPSRLRASRVRASRVRTSRPRVQTDIRGRRTMTDIF